jgi:membrane-bound ClpP family serine protease
MSVWFIILLILLGIVLLIIEFLLLPGIHVAGIAGAILLVGGVVLAYHYHGAMVGNFVLLGTAVLSVAGVYLLLKSRTWKKVTLETIIDSKVNITDKVQPGDEGQTITRLNPMGKIMIHGEYYEGKAIDTYIEPKTEIVVFKVEKNKIIVKPKTD